MSRIELDDFDLENVNGGTVVISNVYNAVGFSTTGQRYDLTVPWKTARDKRDELLEQYPNMGERAFDEFCKQTFDDLGWLAPYTKTKH